MAASKPLKEAAMSNQNKPDPYNGFKSDVERRRALNVRVICFAIVGVAAFQSPGSWASNLKEILSCLMSIWRWLH